MAKNSDNRPILSVTQLNQQVYYLLEQSFPRVFIKGEISNLTCPTSGHWYFSLKDDSAQVRCAMFRSKNQQVRFDVKEGSEVIATAKVTLYQPRGDYQLVVEKLEEFGIGQLQQAFEALKIKLDKAGLFKEEHQQPLPELPKQIGIISSATGAAVRDILRVLKRRMPNIPVIIYPTLVQGELAAGQIVSQIETANRRKECDVLILARGGGSLEDLWPFNEEIVAHAIYNSKIPIVSGVGHQIDFTIADFVADQRAATPSAAAELVSPSSTELKRQCLVLQTQLARLITAQIEQTMQRLDWLNKRLAQVHPVKQINQNRLALNNLQRRLIHNSLSLLTHYQNRLALLAARLRHNRPEKLITTLELKLQQLTNQLTTLANQQLQQKQTQLQVLARALHATSPLATLDRGYAIIKQADTNKIIQTKKDVKPGDKITARLKSLELKATVDEVN